MKLLKKNQMAILVLTLMVATAGYFNYTSNYEGQIVATANEEEIQEESEDNIGDAQLVNSEIKPTEKEKEDSSAIENKEKDEYFIASKLERETMYSQMLDAYQRILESDSISAEQKKIAQADIDKLGNIKNSIMISENLIKLKGFDKCVIFVNNNSISVIVQAETLEQEKIAQIYNIILREFNTTVENIHISNKK